jgi:hypothetical protein
MARAPERFRPDIGARQCTFAGVPQERCFAVRAVLVLLCCLALGGCGLVAAPCRVGSAALKIVPVVGHAAATPTDACAQAIDPG